MVAVVLVEYMGPLNMDNVVKMLNSLFDEDEKISPAIVTIVYRMMMNKLVLSRNVSRSLIVAYDEVVMMEKALFLSFCRLCMWLEYE